MLTVYATTEKAAQGNSGQKIYTWQAQDVVTVLTGGTYHGKMPSDELIHTYNLPAIIKSEE
jgi:hypothetical protein